MVTYPLTFPSVRAPASTAMHAHSVVGMSHSMFTGRQQVYAHLGQYWSVEISLPPLAREDAEVWIAFLYSLNGREGTWLMGDPAAATPRGAAATVPGTPIVDGANQTGQTLNITDGPASTTGYLLAGDYIQLGTGSGSRLHKVLDDADTNGDGDASLTIWPALRLSPSDSSSVVVNNAVGRWRLDTNDTEFDIDEAMFYGIDFTGIEAQ